MNFYEAQMTSTEYAALVDEVARAIATADGFSIGR